MDLCLANVIQTYGGFLPILTIFKANYLKMILRVSLSFLHKPSRGCLDVAYQNWGGLSVPFLRYGSNRGPVFGLRHIEVRWFSSDFDSFQSKISQDCTNGFPIFFAHAF